MTHAGNRTASADAQAVDTGLAGRIHRVMVALLQAVMGLELAVLLVRGQWFSAFLVLAIMAMALLPLLLRDRLPVSVPAEFQIMAVAFVFAALFLGEIRRYYDRYWWWDILLHGASGLLLGLVGFLLVYVLNENRRAAVQMKPRFVAFFAFQFAVTVGVLWEIFEFAMDQFFGLNMQKPMLGDPSGLTDTMWDLIVDTLGAFIISTTGWWYMERGEVSFIESWIRKFIHRNPRLFRR